jgi:hypothetical protein
MTNLIVITATVVVALVTNVEEQLPMRQISVPCPGLINLACLETVPVENPNEKTVITRVKEIHSATFEWGGDRHVTTKERFVSETRQRFAKRATWDAIEPPLRAFNTNGLTP